MTGSSHIPRPPVTEDVGKAIARDIKGPPSSGFASEVPIAFMTHPAAPAPVDPEMLTRTRRTIFRAAAVVVALLALLLIGRWIAG